MHLTSTMLRERNQIQKHIWFLYEPFINKQKTKPKKLQHKTAAFWGEHLRVETEGKDIHKSGGWDSTVRRDTGFLGYKIIFHFLTQLVVT